MRTKLPRIVNVLFVIALFFVVAPQARADIFTDIENVAKALNYATENSTVVQQAAVASDWATRVTLSGCQIANTFPCPEPYDNESLLPYNGSAIGILSNSMALTYTARPANPVTYIADVSERAGLISPAYAQVQGIGFSGLRPLLAVWRGFRNIAYAFLVMAMIIIGFMIMFRRRIDPRTVMTVQAALPRIVITLILVTFSYPLVGLMIDFMYLIIGVGFVAIVGVEQAAGTLNIVSSQSFPDTWQLFSVGMSSVGAIYQMFGGAVLPTASITGGALISAFLTSGLSLLPLAIGAGLAALPFFIVTLAILFAALRLFFTLLNAYIQVLISVIFGPIQIMIGAIPGSTAFSSWFRNLIANLSVFAITAIVLLLAGTLAQNVQTSGELWSPPGIAGNVGQGAAGLIGLGFALLIPNLVGAVKEALKAKPAVQGGAGVLLGPIGTTMGAVQQGVSFFSSARLLSQGRK